MSDYRENGQCTQCAAVMINGVYCHETGCPVRAKELQEEKLADMEEDSEFEEVKNPLLVARQEELSELNQVNAYMSGYSRGRELDFEDENVSLSVSLAGEYPGCDLVHVANMNSLNEKFGYGFCSRSGELDNDILQEMSTADFLELIDMLVGLDYYPVIDDTEHSELEHEIHTEKIADLVSDVESELEDRERGFNEEEIKAMVEVVYWDSVSTGDIFIEHDYAIINDEKEFVEEVIKGLHKEIK